MELTDYQIDILAKTLLGEAAGEGQQGMEQVAHVIKNRAESGLYPSDPVGVALQPGQFSAWNAQTGYNKGKGGNHLVNYGPENKSYQTAVDAVNAVFGGNSADLTGEALNYWAPSGMKGGKDPYWAKGKDDRIEIGNHVFLARGPVEAGGGSTFAPLPAPAPLGTKLNSGGGGFNIGGILGDVTGKVAELGKGVQQYGKNFGGAVMRDIQENPMPFMQGYANWNGWGGVLGLLSSFAGKGGGGPVNSGAPTWAGGTSSNNGVFGMSLGHNTSSPEAFAASVTRPSNMPGVEAFTGKVEQGQAGQNRYGSTAHNELLRQFT